MVDYTGPTVDYTGGFDQEAAQKQLNDPIVDRPEDMGSLGGVQNMLSDLGAVPGAGEPFDFLNALLYGMQGKGGKAGLSLMAMIPFLGGGLKLTQKGSKLAKGKKAAEGYTSGYGDTGAVGRGAVEDVYQGKGGGNYFKNLLSGMFDNLKNKEF